MSQNQSPKRIERPTTIKDEKVGEWYMIEDGSGTIVECVETMDDGRAKLLDDFGTEYIVPTVDLGRSIPRVRGRNDPRPPIEECGCADSFPCADCYIDGRRTFSDD